MMADPGTRTENEGAFVFFDCYAAAGRFSCECWQQDSELVSTQQEQHIGNPGALKAFDSCNAAKEVLLCLCSWKLFGRQCHVDRLAEVG